MCDKDGRQSKLKGNLAFRSSVEGGWLVVLGNCSKGFFVVEVGFEGGERGWRVLGPRN
jgi:hypothetical protein